MLAGRRLLEALIVYCKIDVNQSLKNNEPKSKNAIKDKEESKKGGSNAT